MKKLVKIFMIALLFLMAPIDIYAASGSAFINGSSSVRAGQTTTLRLGFTGSAKIAGAEYTIQASGNLEIVSITGANGANVSQSGNRVIQVVFATEGLASGLTWANVVVRVPSGAKVGSTGTLTVSSIGMSLDGTADTIYPGSVSKTITVAQEPAPVVQKSGDATLKELTIVNYPVTFEKNKTYYDITVANATTALELTALATHAKATVSVTGNENFVVGRNFVNVVVTAENGTQKTYTIQVTRQAEEVKQPECPVCENKEEKKDNEKLVWIIISCVLLFMLLLETGYIIYDKKIKE